MPKASVIGSNPKLASTEVRLGDRTACATLGGGQDITDRAGATALGNRAEHPAACACVNPAVVGAQDERCVPVEARANFAASTGPNPAGFSGGQVASAHTSVLTFVVDEVWVLRVHAHHKPVAAADANPVGVHGSRAIADLGPTAPGAIVLQAAIHAVVVPRSDFHVVELTDGHMVVVVPIFHAIPGHINAPVVAKDHVVPVRGVDPESVVVHVHRTIMAVVLETLATVGGTP